MIDKYVLSETIEYFYAILRVHLYVIIVFVLQFRKNTIKCHCYIIHIHYIITKHHKKYIIYYILLLYSSYFDWFMIRNERCR